MFGDDQRHRLIASSCFSASSRPTNSSIGLSGSIPNRAKRASGFSRWSERQGGRPPIPHRAIASRLARHWHQQSIAAAAGNDRSRDRTRCENPLPRKRNGSSRGIASAPVAS
jgi:hypothetical protein